MGFISYLFLFTIMVFLSPKAFCIDSGFSFPGTILKTQQFYYSGPKNKSFAGASGYGLSINIIKPNEYLAPYVGINIGGQSGRQTFLDGPSEISSSYNYQFGSGEAGLFIFPMGRRESGLNLYINGAGVAGYQQVTLNTTTLLTYISSKSDQGFSSGYKGNFGLEWIIKIKGLRTKWTVYTEVGFKNETTRLFNQNYVLQTFNYSLGLGW